jgi:hypothetical protein
VVSAAYRILLAPGGHPPLTQTSVSESLIQDFEVIHIGNSADNAVFSGSLLQYGLPLENDDLQLQAVFAEPVYCFLVALNPDGLIQLCYPPDRQVAQSEPIRRLRYPEDDAIAFGLTDGAGPQAFVLYASREPLPAFETWQSALLDAAWPLSNVSGGWTYRAGELQSIASRTGRPATGSMDRGAMRRVKTPTEFKKLCDRLRESGNTDVRGVLFAVGPREGRF